MDMTYYGIIRIKCDGSEVIKFVSEEEWYDPILVSSEYAVEYYINVKEVNGNA